MFVTKSSIKRPKVLMTNIAFCDMLSIVLSIGTRFLVFPIVIKIDVLSSHMIQSMSNYLIATTLYVTSITTTIIVCDRYFALNIVFYNPLDRIHTKVLLAVIWIASVVLSLPFLVVSDIYYFDYTNKTLICFNSQNYLNSLNSDKTFKQMTRLFRFVMQFVIPALIIPLLSSKAINGLYDKKNEFISNRQNRSNSSASVRPLQKWRITKRLISLMFGFFVKNCVFHLHSTKTILTLFSQTPIARQQTTCHLETSCFYFDIVFNFCSFLNSVTYFWMSTEFRKQFKTYLNYNWERLRSRSLAEDSPQINVNTISSRRHTICV